MKNDLVCQLNYGHKIWGAVSVIITKRNRDYFLTPPDCVVQEVTNTPDHQKNNPPKIEHFI
jgi:hypothetical protein